MMPVPGYGPPPVQQLGIPVGPPSAAMPFAPVAPAPMGVSIGGIMQISGMREIEAQQRRDAELSQQKPLIQGLAAHVRTCWTAAHQAKQNTVEQRMLQAVRARRGEYDPDKLQKIRQQGGSEIYMMLTSVKCRGASSWLRDILGGKGETKPWTMRPTAVPSLPEVGIDQVRNRAMELTTLIAAQSGQVPSPIEMDKLVLLLKEEAAQSLMDVAKAKVTVMERKMEDQLHEGGFAKALDQFIDDLTTFPAALIKGPVVRKKPTLEWDRTVMPPTLKVSDTLVLEWERIDPFNAYPSPGSSGIDDGYFIERHKMRRGALEALRGVEGYNDNAINAVLEDHGKGGLSNWLMVDSSKAEAEGKDPSAVHNNSEAFIEALQFWGSVSGHMLREWGLTDKEVPDPGKEYPCEVWQIGAWVIKASLNYHPLGLKPYYKASYEDIPGAFWGNSVADLVRDCQDICNSAARALANNMGISSGPQVGINSSRIAPGEIITQMYPWKIWQFTSDPMGGGNASEKAVDFFMPDSNAQELLMVYEKFSVLADEYSGIPRYMTGDSPAGGAGRTASGMSMLMNNANKSMKQVLSNVDGSLFTPLLDRLYFHNMKYSEDDDLKGDAQIVSLGASGVLAKENAQVRRNEFLVATMNPIDAQIIGLEGRAALLRKAVEGLDINPDLVVPSPEKMRLMQQLATLMPQQPQPGQEPGGQQPPQPSAAARPGNGQELMDGAPVTDNFSPAPNP